MAFSGPQQPRIQTPALLRAPWRQQEDSLAAPAHSQRRAACLELRRQHQHQRAEDSLAIIHRQQLRSLSKHRRHRHRAASLAMRSRSQNPLVVSSGPPLHNLRNPQQTQQHRVSSVEELQRYRSPLRQVRDSLEMHSKGQLRRGRLPLASHKHSQLEDFCKHHLERDGDTLANFFQRSKPATDTSNKSSTCGPDQLR